MTSSHTEPPVPMPPVVRRYEVWVAAVFVGSALISLAAPFVLRSAAPWISPLWALPGIPLAIVTTTFGAIWYTRRLKARTKRAVMAASGCVCVGCMYNLGGMGETGACPECGRRFNIAADRRSWRQAGMYE
jgi:tellurite resistance protein TehA-like permease